MGKKRGTRATFDEESEVYGTEQVVFKSTSPARSDATEPDLAAAQRRIREKASQRLVSLDALRGLNMLFIMGLSTLVALVFGLNVSDFYVLGDRAGELAETIQEHWIGVEPFVFVEQMSHVGWSGLRHHDTIFPLFLFLAGVSFPFSLGKQIANGRPYWRIILKVVYRGLALFILGVVYSNGVSCDLKHMRWMGVLQHIGLAWMFAAFIYLAIGRFVKTQLVLCGAILVFYWLVIALVPAPDVAPKEAFTAQAFQERVGDLFKVRVNTVLDAVHLPSPGDEDYPEVGTVDHNLLPEGNFASYIDRKLVPGKLYHQPYDVVRKDVKEYDPGLFRSLYDPEGLASTLPAIVTALLGMFFGGVLRRDDSVCSKMSKMLKLAIGGAVLLLVGWAWNAVFPINKALWNSSFVCFVGGYSALALCVSYFLFDVIKLRWLAFPFVVVGMNSITIYLVNRIVGFSQARDFFFNSAIQTFIPNSRVVEVDGIEQTIESGAFQSIATTCAGLIVCWLFLFWLYRKRIFLKV